MESMNIYFAPMEGITGFVFRNAFHSVFGGVDKFYAPFVSPGPDIGIPKRQPGEQPRDPSGASDPDSQGL